MIAVDVVAARQLDHFSYQGTLKALLLTGLLAELATALWLLIKGLQSGARASSAS